MTHIIHATTVTLDPSNVGEYIAEQVDRYSSGTYIRLVDVLLVQWEEHETPKMPDDFYTEYPNAIWNPPTTIRHRVSVTMLYEDGTGELE